MYIPEGAGAGGCLVRQGRPSLGACRLLRTGNSQVLGWISRAFCIFVGLVINGGEVGCFLLSRTHIPQ